MSKGDLISVEVAYARPDEQVILKVDVEPDARIADAIERSGICRRFPEIDLTQARVGLWSHVAQLDDPVKAGDRIEIYRPLIADPKEVRRQRAAKTKAVRH